MQMAAVHTRLPACPDTTRDACRRDVCLMPMPISHPPPSHLGVCMSCCLLKRRREGEATSHPKGAGCGGMCLPYANATGAGKELKVFCLLPSLGVMPREEGSHARKAVTPPRQLPHCPMKPTPKVPNHGRQGEEEGEEDAGGGRDASCLPCLPCKVPPSSPCLTVSIYYKGEGPCPSPVLPVPSLHRVVWRERRRIGCTDSLQPWCRRCAVKFLCVRAGAEKGVNKMHNSRK